LLASFLASHNPASKDVIYFSTLPGKKRRKKRRRAKSMVKATGPSTFPLTRMLAIFHSLVFSECGGKVADAVTESAHVLASVASLERLGLLVRRSSSSADAHDVTHASYACLMPVEAVMVVAKQLDVDLPKYMYEEDV
jgi:hypothetical protein